ncbi:MAG: hypothetical protein WB996_14465 [Ignavibacteriaceae bacterium]
MNKKYFNKFLQVSALLLPVYFVFYPHLNDNPKDPLVKSLWRFTIAGFCFYGLAVVVIFVL